VIIVGTHSLSLTLRECLSHKDYFFKQKIYLVSKKSELTLLHIKLSIYYIMEPHTRQDIFIHCFSQVSWAGLILVQKLEVTKKYLLTFLSKGGIICTYKRERREKMNEHIELAKKYLADDKLFTQEELDLNVLSANDDFDFWHARYVSDMLSYRKVELFQEAVVYDVWKDVPTDTALDFSSTSWAALSEARIAKAAAQGVAFACAEKERLLAFGINRVGEPRANIHYKRWKKCRTFVAAQIEKYEELST
jgi:hypothetical protein